MKPGILVVLIGVMCVAPNRAQAQDNRDAPEITPHVSIGSAASTGVGAAVRWPVASKLSFELDMGFRSAEVNGLTTNASLLFDLPSIRRVTPYVAGGVGLEQFGSVFESPLGGLVTLKSTAFTVNAGGGIRMPINENWGVRSDARWFNGIGRQAPERWRVYNGITFGRGGR